MIFKSRRDSNEILVFPKSTLSNRLYDGICILPTSATNHGPNAEALAHSVYISTVASGGKNASTQRIEMKAI